MARIFVSNVKTLTDTRHIGEQRNTRSVVVYLMCLVRVSREKKITKNQRKE